MKLLFWPPGCGVASCLGCGESGFVAGALEVPAPEGCWAGARAGIASAASQSIRAREEKSGVRSAFFSIIISPRRSAVEWNDVIGLVRRCFACYPIARANKETAN